MTSLAELFACAGVVAARLEARAGEWFVTLHGADGSFAMTSRPSPDEAIARAAEMLTGSPAATGCAR